MIKRGLKNGFWAAISIRIGSSIGHVIFLLAAYYALSSIKQHQDIIHLIALMGSAFLVYMGMTNIKSESKLKFDDVSSNALSFRQSLGVGFVLAFVNPISIVFWVGIFAASMVNANAGSGLATNSLILVGVMLWGIVLSLALSLGKKVLSPKIIKITVVVSSLSMVCYGLYYGGNAVNYFIN